MTASQSNGGDKDPNRRVSRGGGKPASAGSTFVPRFPGDRPGLDDISVRLPTPFQTSDFAAVAPTEPGPGVSEPVARPKAPATVSVVRSGRDLRLDALRGWCALAMVIDHFGKPASIPPQASSLLQLPRGSSFCLASWWVRSTAQGLHGMVLRRSNSGYWGAPRPCMG